MQINPVKVYSYQPGFMRDNSVVVNNPEPKSGIMTQTNIGLGITALAAMGAAAVSIVKNKKSPAKAFKEFEANSGQIIEKTAAKVQETVSKIKKDYTELPKHENLEKFKVTKVETKETARQRPENVKESLEGIEKLIYVDYGDGTSRVYDRRYFKDEISESVVHENVLKNGESFTIQTVRYNFAYENGKIAGVAKQAIYNNGDVYGIYQGKEWEPFPLMVKMKGEKEFKHAGSYTLSELMQKDPRFDPFNF